jgi:hypothetical protein
MHKQDPLAQPRGLDPHNLRLPHDQWEAAVFDNAVSFTAYAYRPHRRHVCATFKEILGFARSQPDTHLWVLYAITERGRSIICDSNAWDAWLARAEGKVPSST